MHYRKNAIVTSHRSLDVAEPRWFAVYTRHKSEKFVRRMLQKKGIKAWVPLQRFVRRYSKSVKTAELPLINGYVFVHITQRDYLPVLETEHVAGFVRFDKGLVSIPESEIEILRRITLETAWEYRALPGAFTPGDSVQIAAGTLAGMKGKLVAADGKNAFLVELKTIGYSILISVPPGMLERAAG